MVDLGDLEAHVNSVMEKCFSGSLEQLKMAVRNLLSVDSSEIKEVNNVATGKQNGPENTDCVIFTCLELSALEALRDSKGHTVAHIAAAGANLEVLQALLTASPCLAHKVDENGENPLFFAIRAASGSEATVDVTIKSSHHIDCLLLLLGHCGPNTVSKNGASALHVAAELGSITVCRILLENNADVNIYSSQYGTPLTISVIRGYKDVMELLMEHGADPDGIGDGYMTTARSKDSFPPPLVFASSSGQIDIVKALLESGANVNISDSEGWSSLHCAAEFGHLDIAKLLVENGADVNLEIQGKNPYNMAVYNGRENVAKYLRFLTNNIGMIDLEAESEEQHNETIETHSDSSVDDVLETDYNKILDMIDEVKDLGRDFVARKDYKMAAIVYTEGLKKCPKRDDRFIESKALLYANRSMCLLSSGDDQGAYRDAQKAIKYNPKWVKGYYRLARVYQYRGDNIGYLNKLFKAYTKEPENEALCKVFQAEFNRIQKI